MPDILRNRVQRTPLQWVRRPQLSRSCGLCKYPWCIGMYWKDCSHENLDRHSTINNYIGYGLSGKSVNHRQFKHALTLPLALVLYEYLITFPEEIRLVWKRPWTLVSVLLLSVRWNMVLNSLLDFIPMVAQFLSPHFVKNANLNTCVQTVRITRRAALLGYIPPPPQLSSVIYKLQVRCQTYVARNVSHAWFSFLCFARLCYSRS